VNGWEGGMLGRHV